MTATEQPVAGTEEAAVLGALDRVRALFAWKCGGLDAAGLGARLWPSTMTLGGLLKHMALVEEHHFAKLLFDRPPGPPWDAVDWDAEPDWEWTSAAADTPEELMAMWSAAVEKSRAEPAADPARPRRGIRPPPRPRRPHPRVGRRPGRRGSTRLTRTGVSRWG